MRLYLLRHGQARANVARLVTGTPTDPLTDDGVDQARAASLLLQGLHFEAVFSSHWTRAAQTRALAWPDQKVEIEERLGEISGGDVADEPVAEFVKRYPEFRGFANPDFRFPGGESPNELFARVVEWLGEAAERFAPEANVLAVCHLGVISCALQYAFSIPMTEFPRFMPPNASLTCLEVPPNAPARRIRLVFYALTSEMIRK